MPMGLPMQEPQVPAGNELLARLRWLQEMLPTGTGVPAFPGVQQLLAAISGQTGHTGENGLPGPWSDLNAWRQEGYAPIRGLSGLMQAGYQPQAVGQAIQGAFPNVQNPLLRLSDLVQSGFRPQPGMMQRSSRVLPTL